MAGNRIIIALLLSSAVFIVSSSTKVNPCCSFPCQNHGVCMTQGFDDYYCDCTGTQFSGKQCDIPSFTMRIKQWLKPSPETLQDFLQNHQWFWDIVNRMGFLSRFLMKKVYTVRGNKIDSPPTYESEHPYITADANFNHSVYTRALPPVPKDCPTPMGVHGKKQLPDIDVLVEKFFRRTKFIPDAVGTSVLFSYFAQHFTHQFFKTDFKKGPQFQWGSHGVDASHIYGVDKHTQDLLRQFKDGKLITQTINGEEYPPLVKDAPVYMRYHEKTPDSIQFALGHEFYGILPGLFMYATIWLREHNRVCDILKVEHPEWDDERLYQTARLIIIGENLNIAVVDYIQHLSVYKIKLVFDPELLFDEHFQYQNRIALEFNHLYHWHSMMPDEFYIENKTYPLKDALYRADIVTKHGMNAFVDAMSRQRAGSFGPYGHNTYTIPVLRSLIQHGRTLRLQSYNEYRKRFGMHPLASFEELTGEKKLSKELQDLYGDINALEFYIGFILEKKKPNNVFPLSLFEMGGPFSVKGILSNPICSPKYWKPSTFGGEVGFNIIKTATLKKLFCQNIQGTCKEVSFHVPNLDTESQKDHHSEL